MRSRFIDAAEYDCARLLLTVHMRSGAIVHHQGVPPAMFTAFTSDRSPGHYYNRRIKDVFPRVRRPRAARPAPRPATLRWPSLAAYQVALENPASVLKVDELAGALPAAGAWGLPHLVAGRYAAVARMNGPRGEWALRLFTSPPVDEAQRYPALQAFRVAHPLPFLVRAEYRARGITVQGQVYPVVLMQWVEGATLEQWLDADPLRAGSLVPHWRRLTGELAAVGIAHGDLQAGNVMVGPAGLVLVDYDSIEVPQGPTGRRIEGHPDYVPPALGRRAGQVADRVAGLVIEASLLGLAREPGLWARYHDTENLIFTRRDLEDTAAPVWADLARLGDPDLDAALTRLRAALSEPAPEQPRRWQGMSLMDWSASLPARDPVRAPGSAGIESGEPDDAEDLPEEQAQEEEDESVPGPFQLTADLRRGVVARVTMAEAVMWIAQDFEAIEAMLGQVAAAQMLEDACRSLAAFADAPGEDIDERVYQWVLKVQEWVAGRRVEGPPP